MLSFAQNMLAQKTDESLTTNKRQMFLTTNNKANEFGIIKNGIHTIPAFSRLKLVEFKTNKGEILAYQLHPDYPLEKLIEEQQLTNIISMKISFFWQRNWDEKLEGEF
jgi:hypothetical protein